MVLAYLKQRRWLFGAFALFCAIFALSFRLYHLPVEAVAYPAGLCLLLGLGLLAVDYAWVRARHRLLRQLQKHPAALPAVLPYSSSVEVQDYQALVEALRRERRQADDQAAERYGEMVDYYTVWAHQIKTPIAAMRLRLTAEDSPLSRQLRGDLRRIEEYVEMVLAFLRLDSDRSDYVFRSCRLDDIVRREVQRLAVEFIGRRIHLDYSPLETQVVTDEKWLGFVIGQLLSNALKYTPEGGCISIAMTGPLHLTVADTGIGIAPEDLPRIFDKGYTGYNGREDLSASGIGLYLCRRICGNLGADISAASTPGVGTSITVDLSAQGRLSLD